MIEEWTHKNEKPIYTVKYSKLLKIDTYYELREMRENLTETLLWKYMWQEEEGEAKNRITEHFHEVLVAYVQL